MLLILPPRTEDDGEFARLAQTADCLGWSVHRSSFSWRIPQELLGQEGAVYGKSYFCQVIAEQMNWDLLANPIDWLTGLTEEYVRRTISISTLENARLLKEKRFVKPAEEDRFFPAGVYEDGSKLPASTMFDDAPVLVSGTIPYATEWRCFVKDRVVVSASCYRMNKEFNQTHLWHWDANIAIDFVNKLLSDESVVCVPGVSIDVGRSKKGYLSIIESSPAWASDLYGCELVGTLDAIKASCVMRKQ
jgi:ATP-grasp domain-containing protein